ncbi:hypothetical protein RJ639_030924 [Escallonia herrerae]|uniref:Ubiquitin-specific protease family C19-related protein n=1 Tax=Escallonia herrerae TaxID=1293975 RepID=A0AA89BB79_9ASTE|nr:hypothetical protein RJ639_030924 [Escallonia herrerae]
MGSRIPSHQLSNGLYVSGRPEQLKERLPSIGSRSVPYTGGDVKKSGELGKMFDIPVFDNPPSLKTSRPSSSSQHNSGSVRSGPNSGPMGTKPSHSGSIPRKSSGPVVPLQPTGLITSGPLGSSVGRRSGQLGQSGQLEQSGSVGKAVYGSAVTVLGEDLRLGFRVSKAAMWVVAVVVVMGLVVGAFLTVAVKKVVILVAVGAVAAPMAVVLTWNCAWKKRGLLGYLTRYPDAELRGAVDGQYVKVTGRIDGTMNMKVSIEVYNFEVKVVIDGMMNMKVSIEVVTCGSIPLESSFQKVQRCVYASTELYEYRGWGGKSANPKHSFFSWGCRHSEIVFSVAKGIFVTSSQKFVADFYISDFQSGLRALVKAGYGAKVAPFVKPTTVADITKENRELSPSFLRWLADRSLSSDDRVMRLKEGYIKEGSTVSVMGVVRRHDNVLLIVPPSDPLSTGCQWARCLLPTYVEGLILTCDESQNADVIPV